MNSARRILTTAAVLPALAAGALLTGCADDAATSGAARDGIEQTLERSFVKDEGLLACSSISRELMRETYDDAGRCRTVTKGRGTMARSVKVAEPRVDGDSATVHVTMQGGDADGLAGEVEMVREDGAWKISDLKPAMVLATMRAAMHAVSGDPTEPLAIPSAIDCWTDQMAKVPASDLRRFTLNVVGGRTKVDAGGTGMKMLECLRKTPEGRAGLRKELEEQLDTELDAYTAGCVKERLRSDVSDEELAAKMGPNSPELTELLSTAGQACAAG